MRITFNSHYREAEAGLSRASERLADLQRQVATGRRINRPSDAPADAATSVSERGQLAAVEHYRTTADTVGARMAVLDTVLSDIIDRISAAQTATAAVRGSGRTAAQRDAAAEQLLAIRSTLMADLNTSFHGVYLFAGTAASTRPFVEGAGGAIVYDGNAAEAAVDVSASRAVTVSFDGRELAQGGEVADIFATLSSLVDAARSGDEAVLSEGMAALTRALERATTMQARIGNSIQTLEIEQQRLQQLRLATQERVADLENADMAAAISGMTQADAAYRAALGAIGTVGRVSLMDYLK